MAQPNPELISALQNTVRRLEGGVPYQWGHMGHCNCGLLAQEISELSAREIHEMGMEKSGDWNTHCQEFCPASGFRIDRLITTLLSAGLEIDDLAHLEQLDDPHVLRRLSANQRYLRHNSRTHLIIYMKAWLKILEESWLSDNPFPIFAIRSSQFAVRSSQFAGIHNQSTNKLISDNTASHTRIS